MTVVVFVIVVELTGFVGALILRKSELSDVGRSGTEEHGIGFFDADLPAEFFCVMMNCSTEMEAFKEKRSGFR